MVIALPTLPAFNLRMPAREHLLVSILLAAMAALCLVGGMSIVGLGGFDEAAARTRPVRTQSIPRLQSLPGVPPAEPTAVLAISPEDAMAVNASIPLSTLPNPAARAFVLSAASDEDRVRALDCLTAAVYYEAVTEPIEGQRAVAQVVLNRVRHPAYPNSVCAVVFEGSERSTGCQFTFTCDGALARTPFEAGWRRAKEVAAAALAGKVYAPVGYATHYHTNWVVPYWASNLVKAANVGTHIFYRWTEGWGRPPAFRTPYAGAEPKLAAMRGLSAVHDVPLESETELAADAALEADTASAEPTVRQSYEPLRQEAAAAQLNAQLSAGAYIPATHNWALTGQPAGPVEAALGRKVASAAPATAPEACRPAGKASKFGPPGGYGPVC